MGIKVLFSTWTFFIWSLTFVMGQKDDTVLIHAFNSTPGKLTSSYSGLQAHDQMMYFATSSGVARYDGTNWTYIPLLNDGYAISLLEYQDTVFVGGVNDIGFLAYDSTGMQTYYSMRSRLPKDAYFEEVWQIVPYNGDLYFQSYNMILRKSGNFFSILPIENAFLFNVKETLIASIYEKGLGRVQNDTILKMVHENDDVLFDTKTLPSSLHLAFTPDSGIYEINPSTLLMKPWRTEASSFLKKYSFYKAAIWQDSLVACTTWRRGVLIMDDKGSILQEINSKNGLPSEGLKELFVDHSKNIWVTSNTGIYELKWPGISNFEDEASTLVRRSRVSNPVPWRHVFVDTVQSHSKSFSFQFVTPGIDREDLSYSTKLEGFDSNWSIWDDIDQRDYTNLLPGTYTFTVKGRLPDARETEKASYTFTIIDYWYKSTWFYLLIALLLGTLILLGNQLRLRRLRSYSKKLEQDIYKRTRELIEQREQLKQTNKALEISNSELDQFVYRSSHDLIAPLKSMRGLIEIASMEAKEDSLRQYLEMMNHSVLKLERFINSILEFSRNVKQEVKKESIDLDDLVDNIYENIEYLKRLKKVLIIREFEVKAIQSDEKRLSIVLSNLIINSIKYYDPKKDKPYVKITSSLKGPRVIINVEDNGLGIAKEHLNKIFDMFYRASAESDGSGLGLYIVKDTVDKLGGTISVESEMGAGSRFCIVLEQ